LWGGGKGLLGVAAAALPSRFGRGGKLFWRYENGRKLVEVDWKWWTYL
jgi:hypothetical protein